MKAIYKFHVDCGRMGELDGVFSCEKSDLENIYGETIYFGEVLGKHSDIFTVLEPKHITEVTDDVNFIKLFDEYDLSSGFNPLDYYEEEYSDEENEDNEYE